jgi:hypothetical protein
MRTYARQTLAERFWPKVRRAGPDECWDWQGARTGLANAAHRYGYLGRIPASSLGPLVPAIGAHVVSWILHNGPIPTGIQVCHKCDRPICVNPNHLFLGTQADNNRDRYAKGRDGDRYRRNWNTGAHNPRANLTFEQAQEIRERYSRGGVSQARLGAEFGVKQAQVSRIVRGVSYLT